MLAVNTCEDKDTNGTRIHVMLCALKCIHDFYDTFRCIKLF